VVPDQLKCTVLSGVRSGSMVQFFDVSKEGFFLVLQDVNVGKF